MSLKVTSDTLSPAVRAMARRFSDLKPILRAMGEALVGVTKRSFNDASLRPSTWAPVKKQGGAPLKRHGTMWQSIREIALTGSQVEIGTDRPYAPWHQWGTKPYTIRPKSKRALYWPGAGHPVRQVKHPGVPARPFFPFTPDGQMTEAGRRVVEHAALAKMRALAKQSGANPS